jgi:glycosyltransferase involved in cell wall biosynthesis
MLSGRVSVIIPVHNDEKTIVRSLNSVVNQSYKNIEVLVIENGSTDATLEAVQKFIEKEKTENIRLFSSKTGRSVARNKGLLEAKGEFIAFLDADDTLCPLHIERAINVLQKKHTFFAYAGGAERVIDGKVISTHNYLNRHITDLAYENFFVISSIVLRNQNIKLFNEKISTNEDWLFWIQNLMYKNVFLDNRFIATQIFITGDNTMRNIFRMRESMVYVKALGKEKNPNVYHSNVSLVKNMFAFLSGDLINDKEIRRTVQLAFPMIFLSVSMIFHIPLLNKILIKKVKHYYSSQVNQYTIGGLND